MRLSGKRLVVTAAGNGIGRACVTRLANEGATIFATDIDGAALAQLPVGAAKTAVIDGADAAAVADYFAGVGRIDGAVHCVGFVHQGTILECDHDCWRDSFRINVDSFYHLLQALLPRMIADGGGSIACIASVASSIRGLPRRAAYGATKAALIGMAKSVAADYAEASIRCNAVCPGTVMTPSLRERMAAIAASVGGLDQAMQQFVGRQPMGRLGQPEEIAALCAYLMSDDSAFVTGQHIAIDGGITI